MTLIEENKLYANWDVLTDCLKWSKGEKSYKMLPYALLLKDREPKENKGTWGGKRR